MSELQTALLVIGFSVIIAVYVIGWWQQWRYRRKFAATFRTTHADVLYQGNDTQPAARQPEFTQTMESKTVATPDEAWALPSELPCALLDTRTDFIIELHLVEPSPGVVLDGLWQRKFDFDKPMQVCGLTLAGKQMTAKQWERATADGQTLYTRFRIALQLVDRGGAISVARLADFRDLVRGIALHIKADTTIPDLDKTHLQAVELDAFCAAVDQMVGVNLVAQKESLLIGAEIAQAADTQGMTLEPDGAFHLLDAQGHSLFRLVNRDTQPFQHHTLNTFITPGITLLLDVPRVQNPAEHFDQLMRVAHELARQLQVKVVDDHGMALGDSNLARIRAQIAEVEMKMCDHGIAPGGAQAHRLFS